MIQARKSDHRGRSARIGKDHARHEAKEQLMLRGPIQSGDRAADDIEDIEAISSKNEQDHHDRAERGRGGERCKAAPADRERETRHADQQGCEERIVDAGCGEDGDRQKTEPAAEQPPEVGSRVARRHQQRKHSPERHAVIKREEIMRCGAGSEIGRHHIGDRDGARDARADRETAKREIRDCEHQQDADEGRTG